MSRAIIGMMALRRSAEEVRELLRTGLRSRLEPAGWEMLDTKNDHFRLVAFGRALSEGFAATCEVGRASAIPDRPPVSVTSVRVGVSYEPLRRLSPLLDLYELGVLSEQVWPETAGQSDRDAVNASLKIATDEEINAAAELLAGVIIRQAVPYAEQHADVDGLIAELSPVDADHARLAVAALQAAAGRLLDARLTLTRLGSAKRSEHTRPAERRAAWQLARWIDSGGDRSLIPESAPPDRFRSEPRPSIAEIKAQHRAERAALDEVRATASDQARPQARETLRQALARHGAHEKSPLWIESQLDHLWDSREDQIVRVAQGVNGLLRFGVGAARAIRDRQLPDLTRPDWIEPPAHALYESPPSGNWCAVALDPHTTAYLDRVFDETPRVFGPILVLHPWIRGVDGADPDCRDLEVLIGEQPVGKILSPDAAVYAPLLAAAARRGEHPCLDAHLAHRNGQYILEVATPSEEV